MDSADSPTGLTYRDAGVDIDAGADLVERIKSDVAATRRPGMVGGLGGFGGLFELPVDRYRQPLLVAGTDGVGTKLRLALETGRHDGIGVDLVAMCVNDVIVTGAEPLFFLDYYATGRLDPDIAERVIRGIATGCKEAGAGLIGGETAEMPGMYSDGDYDLAGFCVGVVERDRMVDGADIRPGDALIALGSSGVHANGYSLVRRILEREPDALTQSLDGRRLDEWLLTPTRIYARTVQRLLNEVTINGISHITGGGLTDNVPRVIPQGLTARIDTGSWQWPALFDWLQRTGDVDTGEMRRTFNCGVGMVLAVPAAEATNALDILRAAGESAWVIGEATRSGRNADGIVYREGA